MYGEGNSAKLVGDIVNSTTQIAEGISAGMGIDLKSILLGALGTSPCRWKNGSGRGG